ncbi:MAG: hypothetical protein ABIH99_04455 [Candidatus Micrarchaeota archaeon]
MQKSVAGGKGSTGQQTSSTSKEFNKAKPPSDGIFKKKQQFIDYIEAGKKKYAVDFLENGKVCVRFSRTSRVLKNLRNETLEDYYKEGTRRTRKQAVEFEDLAHAMRAMKHIVGAYDNERKNNDALLAVVKGIAEILGRIKPEMKEEEKEKKRMFALEKLVELEECLKRAIVLEKVVAREKIERVRELIGEKKVPAAVVRLIAVANRVKAENKKIAGITEWEMLRWKFLFTIASWTDGRNEKAAREIEEVKKEMDETIRISKKQKEINKGFENLINSCIRTLSARQVYNSERNKVKEKLKKISSNYGKSRVTERVNAYNMAVEALALLERQPKEALKKLELAKNFLLIYDKHLRERGVMPERMRKEVELEVEEIRKKLENSTLAHVKEACISLECVKDTLAVYEYKSTSLLLEEAVRHLRRSVVNEGELTA